MELPNASNAVIPVEKLRDYLLNVEHIRGVSKARLLLRLGFTRANWPSLEVAIRKLVAENDAQELSTHAERRFSVVGNLEGPSGSRRFRTIWVLDEAEEAPRLTTAYPVSTP